MNDTPKIGETYTKIIVDSDLGEGDEMNDYYNNCVIDNVTQFRVSEGVHVDVFHFRFESYYKMFQGKLIRVDGPSHPRTHAITGERPFELIP